MSLIRSVFEKPLHRLLNPIVLAAARSNINPNTISTAGFIGNLVAAAFLFCGQFVVAGLLVWFAGILDMLDGKVARYTKQVSVYGAVYDATLDRISEIAIYTGMGAYFIVHGRYITAFIVVLATGGSFLISYVRARAESYDIPCSVGVLCKGERVFLLGMGLVLNFLGRALDRPMRLFLTFIHLPHKFPPMPIAIVLLAVAILSPITVAQRLLHIKETQRING
jgi:CDP-diacylglycerol--glycerol-3-phosphate 3-phosphatidyltransferase